MMQQRGLGFDHSSRAQQWMGQAGNIASAFDRKQFHQKPPGKSAGGALMSGASGAMAGASVGSTAGGAAAGGAAASGAAKGSKAGWWGAAIGAVVGLGAYLLS